MLASIFLFTDYEDEVQHQDKSVAQGSGRTMKGKNVVDTKGPKGKAVTARKPRATINGSEPPKRSKRFNPAEPVHDNWKNLPTDQFIKDRLTFNPDRKSVV